MKKSLVILILIAVNLTVFASYVETCEITGILTEDSYRRKAYIRNEDGSESAESSLILEMEVIEVKIAGRADNKCCYKKGIKVFDFESGNIFYKNGKYVDNFKKGQKVRFIKIYKDNKGKKPETRFYDFEVLE